MVTVDLRQDAAEILALLKDAVQQYTARHRAASTAQSHPLVGRIDLTFSLGDSQATPWVRLNFDTKPGGEPDGDPTHPDFARLEREAWLPAIQAVCDGEPVAVVGPDGESEQCDDAGLGDKVGRLLVSCLLEARSAGLFADLPTAHRCELGVEDPMTGEFGWPKYEERGKVNLV